MIEKRSFYFEGFRLYPFQVAGHMLQGAGAALGAMFFGVQGMVLAGIWTALYIAYQGLSVLRKSDSPGLDIADYMLGMSIGMAAGAVWKVLA